MIASFVQPWATLPPGELINVNGQLKTEQELRQQLYENVLDEVLFVSRASEGAVSAEWVMNQPIFIRKKYVESLSKELKEREQLLKSKQKR